ncbi:hypothetical protein TIFTF001_029474 [Ficus carica]|uniref:Uncharacterized protein n=1 Tax=Ficus carica TaxID=3494 RepID=A0AA88J2H5_FICCA|nr:hypothetical protein TIFTF001_029474 [Ficus carica]
MKLAPVSTGSYYFQGYQGTFITGCPNSDKQFKHLWFYAGCRWLHGHLPYGEVRERERVPITFRRGYVWTRGPYMEAGSLEKIEILREKVDPKRNQHGLLSPVSLEKYHWFGSSSTFDNPNDGPRTAQPRKVTVASRMPDPVVHYRARTVVTAEVATTSDWFEVSRGVPVAPSHDQRSGSSSPGTWGPRVADEDMDLVLWQLFPARGLRIKNPRWPSGNSEGVNAPMTRIGWPGSRRSPKPVMVARAERGLQSRSRAAGPLCRSRREDTRSRDPSSSAPGAKPIRRKSSTQKAFVNEFDDRLTFDVAESSRHSDPIKASIDLAICLAFSGNVAVQDLFNRMEEKVTSLDSEAKTTRSAEERAKVAEEKVKDAKKRVSQAESARRKAEEARHDAEKRTSQVEDDLAATRSEYSRYIQEVHPAALDQARLQAVEEYQNSDEFNTCLLAEYKDGMRDMKAGFNLTNPTVTGVLLEHLLQLAWVLLGVEPSPILVDDQHWDLVPSSRDPRLYGRSCSVTSYGWLGFSMELTRVQLWSVTSIGTSFHGPGTFGVGGLPKQTLWSVLLGHLLRLARVFHGIDPGLTLVGDQ